MEIAEERKRERKTSLLPPLLATEAISIAKRGERRGKSVGEMEEELSSSFPLRALMPACRRGGRKMEKTGASREREKRERERRCHGREKKTARERLRERGFTGEREVTGERFYGRERGYGRGRSYRRERREKKGERGREREK